MITFPDCKINLGLNVVERRPDGYHNLETVFYPVPITDALEVQAMDELFPSAVDCDLKVTNLVIEGDEQRNLVVRAYQLLKQDFPQLPRVHVHLYKNIPTQAGMGGGSSDCAFMLSLLNEQFALGLSKQQLIGYAARLGADCAFFILNEPAYAEGIGERLQPVDLRLQGMYLAVVRPDIPVSTKEAFSLIKPQRPAKNCRDIVMQPVETWREELKNAVTFTMIEMKIAGNTLVATCNLSDFFMGESFKRYSSIVTSKVEYSINKASFKKK